MDWKRLTLPENPPFNTKFKICTGAESALPGTGVYGWLFFLYKESIKNTKQNSAFG
jgi:hypothetical protein